MIFCNLSSLVILINDAKHINFYPTCQLPLAPSHWPSYCKYKPFIKSIKFYLFCYKSLREKYPNTKFFLVCIFPHSDWIRRDTKYLFVFNPNAGKYVPEKTPYLDTSHTVTFFSSIVSNLKIARYSNCDPLAKHISDSVLKCIVKYRNHPRILAIGEIYNKKLFLFQNTKRQIPDWRLKVGN